MTETRFGEQACHKFRAKLDSYIDNELLTESNLEMIEHFRWCASCTQEAQERRNVRCRLQNAVRKVPVPAGLEQRIRDRLRQPKRPQPKKLFLLAIAAALWSSFGVFPFRDPSGELVLMVSEDPPCGSLSEGPPECSRRSSRKGRCGYHGRGCSRAEEQAL